MAVKQYIAKTRFVIASPAKVRPVADVVRRKPCTKALALLENMPQKGAKLIYKTVKSAVANALDLNKKLDEDMLFIKEIRVDEAIMTDYHSWSLESIELKDDCTLCKWTVTSLTSETGVYMINTPYLEDVLTGRKYYSIGVEGIPYKPDMKIIHPQYGSVDYIVKFPPLSKTVKQVHYISSSTFQIKNIKLNKIKKGV
jgi:hypothetical protein